MLLFGLLSATFTITAPHGLLGSPENSFAIRASVILRANGNVIRDGVIVVRDGRLATIGTAAEVSIPRDLIVVHEPDAWVMPGLVAASSRVAGTHFGTDSIGAGFHAVDAFDRYADFRAILKGGVTTVHVDPGAHRLVTGQGAIVKLGGPPEGRVLRARSDLCIQFGDLADRPPDKVTIPFPASADVPIEPPQIQGPTSRLTRVRDFVATLDAALHVSGTDFDFHRSALAIAWGEQLPLRIRADRAVDLRATLRFLNERGLMSEAKEGLTRRAYLVGGAEALKGLSEAERTTIGLVYEAPARFRSLGGDLGSERDAPGTSVGDLSTFPHLAVVPPRDQSVGDLRLTALQAHAAGLSEARALSAMTSAPAKILGVDNRVGRLASGLDADLVILTGHPFDVRTQVKRVYVSGTVAYESPENTSTVIRAGLVWVSPEKQITNGEILLEDGKIAAVGKSVPHPPTARVVDAGPRAFVTPGFIDARSHLGLEGATASTRTSVDLTRLVGVPNIADLRVARAGITTVLLSPRNFSSTGSRFSAIKTAGDNRDLRVVRQTAAIGFGVSSRQDPLNTTGAIRSVLARGKKYLAAWKKYETALAKYLEQKKKGGTPKPNQEEKKEEPPKKADPVTGIWEGAVSGGPIFGNVTGKVAFRLEEKKFVGRIIEPDSSIRGDWDPTIVLTLEGRKLTGHIDVDTGGLGQPRIEGEIYEDDKFRGTISVTGVNVSVEGVRIEKGDAEFRILQGRSRRKDGRPVPPRIDENLEPIKSLLEKKIPAVVQVSQPKHIEGILDFFLNQEKLPLILLDANGAPLYVDLLAKEKVGVILDRPLVSVRKFREFQAGDVLSRGGVPIAFQSEAEDGARDLATNVTYAVARGLAADTALAGFTSDAAKMFKIDDRVGTLEQGKDADVVIFTGHPFRGASRPQRVFVNGKEVK